VASPKILVVDDELELQRLIRQRFRRQIESKQMDFVFASNGVDALLQLQQDRQIDMVITDINMPDMDGLTFIHCLPSISETLKAVVISAYSDLSQIRQAMNEGAFDFLTKPLDFQDLEQTIAKTLAHVQQLKAKQQQIQTLQEELRRAAFHDALTDLPNRTWLQQHLEHLFKQRRQLDQGLIALLFIDLDGFKEINDTFGHEMGDLLLKRVAERLKSCLRKGDLAARLGGDEFIIVLENISEIGIATMVAHRVQDYLAQAVDLNGSKVTIGASIGIALSDNEHRYPDELMRKADIAMYAAKARGKGCFVIFDEDIH
jgi:diguanylate cyclase (GGDEF)-like protein